MPQIKNDEPDMEPYNGPEEVPAEQKDDSGEPLPEDKTLTSASLRLLGAGQPYGCNHG